MARSNIPPHNSESSAAKGFNVQLPHSWSDNDEDKSVFKCDNISVNHIKRVLIIKCD